MSLTFLRADVLRSVQAQLIQSYGGLPGLRSEAGLESAVSRPLQLQHYAGEQHVGALAASLAWALLRNHAFADGNKRIALAAFVMFSDLNGYRLDCSEAEETAMFIRAADSTITEDDWTLWALHVTKPK